MSTLTKVFIVLLSVFSIAFTTMTVSIVAQWADWKELANDYQQHAVVADTNLRHMIAANAAELAAANDTIRGHLEQIGELENTIVIVTADNAPPRKRAAPRPSIEGWSRSSKVPTRPARAIENNAMKSNGAGSSWSAATST